MILGDAMFHLAKTASEDKLFDKWVLEKQACLDKDYLPRFSKELSSIKKLRKSKKEIQFARHMTLVFIFYWEMRDDWRVENYSFVLAQSAIMLMKETSMFMPEEIGDELRDFDFLRVFKHWQHSVVDKEYIEKNNKLNGSENNDVENSSEFA
jgi:hypothetical protein